MSKVGSEPPAPISTVAPVEGGQTTTAKESGQPVVTGGDHQSTGLRTPIDSRDPNDWHRARGLPDGQIGSQVLDRPDISGGDQTESGKGLDQSADAGGDQPNKNKGKSKEVDNDPDKGVDNPSVESINIINDSTPPIITSDVSAAMVEVDLLDKDEGPKVLAIDTNISITGWRTTVDNAPPSRTSYMFGNPYNIGTPTKYGGLAQYDRYQYGDSVYNEQRDHRRTMNRTPPKIDPPPLIGTSE